MLGFESTFREILPDESGLLRWLSKSLDNTDRDYIAACDYRDQVAEHRAAIDQILASGRVSAPFPWVPREVLALTRWTTIDVDTPEGDALWIHRHRLFATSALMAQLALDPLDEDASEDTLFGMVDSAIALGQQPLALGMLRWILQGLEARVTDEARLAEENGEEDFEAADVTGREVAFLPLAMLILDRSQASPGLSSSAVRSAVDLARALDHPYLDEGVALPNTALFHSSTKGMREDEWRVLLSAAIDRERARPSAGSQDLEGETATAFVDWLEMAVASGGRSRS